MHLRDTLLRLADRGLYRVHWSADILTELERTLTRRGVEKQRVQHLFQEMHTAFPYAEVHSYAYLVRSMKCHRKDRHVLAAAVKCGAEAIVTHNVKDFPATSTQPHRIDVLHPSDFLLDLYDLAPNAVRSELVEQANDNQREPRTLESLLGALGRAGVEPFANRVGNVSPPRLPQ